jgi:hypothetical protein
MLIAKGCAVSFKLASGKEVFAPSSYAMLHDPSGSEWPADSVLIAPFKKTRSAIEDSDAESYFGAPPLEGKIELPPSSLSSWSEVGVATRIDYTRRRPDGLHTDFKGDYRHEFDGTEGVFGLLFHVLTAPSVMLYRRGRLLRLELPFGADLGDRGFVWP